MIRAFWRRKVDLPPMFGPVTSHSRRLLGQPAIIGDEARAARPQRLLDHRMAAGLDLEAGLLVEARPAPAALGRALGQRRGDVEPGERVGGGGDRLGAVQRRLDQLLEMRGLGGERMGARLAHLAAPPRADRAR